MPLFASDPHLSNGLPTHWLLYNLKLPSGKILSGAQLAGLPLIAIGRSNDITWGCTTARADTADLWQEKLNEDETEYFVDGTWRKFNVIEEVIKIKGQPDKVVKVKSTHRGVVLDHELLRINSALLFGGAAGRIKNPPKYSLAWQG